MGARSSPIYKCLMGKTNYFMMLCCRSNGIWVSLGHCQDGVVVLLSEWHDTSLPPHALLFLQNPVTEVAGGEVGRPSCWASCTHICHGPQPQLAAQCIKAEGEKPATIYPMLVLEQPRSPLKLQETWAVPGSHSAGKQGPGAPLQHPTPQPPGTEISRLRTTSSAIQGFQRCPKNSLSSHVSLNAWNSSGQRL